jgi:hypothetical protein
MLKNTLINRLTKDNPAISIRGDERFYWQPETLTVHYDLSETEHFNEYILHEMSHAQLSHQNSYSDIGLLRMEVDAWENAKVLALRYSIEISDEIVQNSLNTYRSWLYKRSLCPKCKSNGIQIHADIYCCTDCYSEWQVGNNVFSRCYRKNIDKN